MKPDDLPNRFLLRLACVGAVDAREMACNGTIFLSFDMIADDEVFTAALHKAGWYASVCNVPPDIGNGTGQVLCPLCPKCAAYLLGKETLKLADQALEKARKNATGDMATMGKEDKGN